MSEWWEDLDGLLEAAWAYFEAGANDPGAPARFLAFATAGQTGGAEARMVVLRGADRARAELIVHTDTLSAKVAELRADPRASLLMWDPGAKLQVRAKAEVGIDTGAVVSPDWDRIPHRARRVYGNEPEPGGVMHGPMALTVSPDPARFAVMTCRVTEIDVLHLGREVHHRALFRRRSGWAGKWIAP